jgi:DNA polymerase-1
MNLVRTEAPGFEADDLIASYATKFAETNGKVVIVSSDKDLLALLDNKISVYDSMKRKWYTPEAVVERYGVPPNLLVDYLAIVGDTADNIPGVQGMGGKTAADLLNEYGSLENILFNAHKLKSNKQMILKRQMLIALHSKSLVKMCLDIKLPIPLQQLELRQFDSDRFKSFCKKHELNQLANRAYKEEVKLSTPFKGATLY